jgi:hypothetical protein
MSVTTTVNQIDQASATYAPAVLTGVLAVEKAAAGLPGETKSQLVVNTIVAGATAAEGVPVPAVQGIAALVALFCTILNAAGIFKPKPAPAAAPLTPGD